MSIRQVGCRQANWKIMPVTVNKQEIEALKKMGDNWEKKIYDLHVDDFKNLGGAETIRKLQWLVVKYNPYINYNMHKEDNDVFDLIINDDGYNEFSINMLPMNPKDLAEDLEIFYATKFWEENVMEISDLCLKISLETANTVTIVFDDNSLELSIEKLEYNNLKLVIDHPKYEEKIHMECIRDSKDVEEKLENIKDKLKKILKY